MLQNANFPKKSSYSFDEIIAITEVKPYVLRYWESEFSQISAIINEQGQKIYSLADLYIFLRIKELLFVEKKPILEAKTSLNLSVENISTSERADEIEPLEQLNDQDKILVALESLKKANSLISSIKQTW